MRPTNALKCKLSTTNHHPNDNFDTYMDGLQNKPTGHRPKVPWGHRSLKTEPLCEVTFLIAVSEKAKCPSDK